MKVNAGEKIVLPLLTDGIRGNADALYDFTIEWDDGSSQKVESTLNPILHTYNKAGTYTVTIDGTIKGWNFFLVPDSRDKLVDVSQTGSLQLVNNDLGGYFSECINMTWTAKDALDLTGIGNLQLCFYGCYKFNGEIGKWQTGNITNMNVRYVQ